MGWGRGSYILHSRTIQSRIRDYTLALPSQKSSIYCEPDEKQKIVFLLFRTELVKDLK